MPWRRRRRFPFFIEEMMRDMERMMEEMLEESEEFTRRVPKDLARERRGPFVHGFSISFGPSGKPVIREFGNLKPSARARPWGAPFDLREEREPLVDVLEGNEDIRVIAELPGVEKQDIRLHATERTLTISVDAKERKYHKELELPAEVDPKSARSSYKNGVLEVTLRRVEEEKPRGEQIKID